MRTFTKRTIWWLILRALAMLIHRQAFPDFRDMDADWERKTNALTTELEGLAEDVRTSGERIQE